MKVQIRKITLQDASISYIWRNDQEIWKTTGRNWSKKVTLNDELEWIKKVINDKSRLTFAICIGENQEYVGNVQLTDIDEIKGVFHIFIGNKNVWGKGIGTEATKLLLEYAKQNLSIKYIFLKVLKTNKKAYFIYKNAGFIFLKEVDQYILMKYEL